MISRSLDAGYTWSPLERLSLRISGESREKIVTGAAHHILRLDDGRLLITWGHRDDSTIRAAVSEDRGLTCDNCKGPGFYGKELISETLGSRALYSFRMVGY